MRTIRILVVLGLAALAAGCFTAGSVVEVTPAPATVAALPGGAPELAAQADYSLKAELEYRNRDYGDPNGSDVFDIHFTTARISWYPGGVQDSEAPFALQPYLQRAGVLSLGAGVGEADFSGDPNSPFDSQTVDVSAGFFGEQGLGARFSYLYEKVRADDAEDLTYHAVRGEAVWQTENGFSVAVALSTTGAHLYEEMSSYVDGYEQGGREFGVGVRNVFTFGPGHALDLEGGLGIRKYDYLDQDNVEDHSTLFRLRATYYPVKMLGIGFDLETLSFAASEGDADGLDHVEFGGHVSVTVAERFDIAVRYATWENDLTAPPATGEIADADKLWITLGVRF